MDDFAEFAVERDLLTKLNMLFPPEIVLDMVDEDIACICAETIESQEERSLMDVKSSTLQKARDVLVQLDRVKPRDTSSSANTAQA